MEPRRRKGSDLNGCACAVYQVCHRISIPIPIPHPHPIYDVGFLRLDGHFFHRASLYDVSIQFLQNWDKALEYFNKAITEHAIDDQLHCLRARLKFCRRAYDDARADYRSEEHTSELQSLMRISYAVFCLKKKNNKQYNEQHMLA